MADLSSLLGAAGIGGAIGKAIVSLELETTKYNAELEAANAKTVATTNSSASAISKFGGIASAAFLSAGVAAVAFGAFSVKAAIEANDAHLKLANTFKNNASLADSSVAAFERQADALRDLTGVDDEAIISSQALLGQFKLTGTQILQLTPLIVDLSEKMGVSLETAAKAVGKATQGTTTGLLRMGIQVDATKASIDPFAATLDSLSRVQGFAAESAKAEPWRVMGAQFEEVAEKLGQALLPALQNLAKGILAIMPFLEGLIEGFIQLGHYVSVAVKAVISFFDAITGQGVGATEDQVKLIGDVAGSYIEAAKAADKAGNAVQGAGTKMHHFAGMSAADIKEWGDKTKESFQTYVINLDKVNTATDFTRKDLRESFQAMLEHARDLNQAMRTLSREHWINDDFVKFLAEQPDKLILFANSNETQQRRMQHQWETSGEILKNQVNDRLDVMTGVLDKLDKGETKHRVTIVYDYVGFDPSKPGMDSAVRGVGGHA